MPRVRASRLDPGDFRSTYERFDREMSALVQLYAERATASSVERAIIDEEIARQEEEVRGAWSRLGTLTREPLATHL